MSTPPEFLNDMIKAAKENIVKVADSGVPNVDTLLRVAEIQVEMAKVSALTMIAHALQERR